MNKIFASLLVLLFSFGVFGQISNKVLDISNYGVSIEPDKRLITVLATLEAAGIETTLSERGEEFRKTLRKDLSEIDPNLKRKMKVFVDQYAKRWARRYRNNISESESDAAIKAGKLEDFDVFLAKYRRGLSEDEKKIYLKKYASYINLVKAPFISMAYTLSPAPALDEPKRSLDLPDNLLEVLDYSVLVREFYRSDGIAAKIDSYYKMNRELGDKMRPEARKMVRNVLDYLHTRPELTSKEIVKVESTRKGKKKIARYETRIRERSFKIVPELLATKGTINFLNIRDNYYAIVPPNTDLSSSEVRRGFLQFVLDPLVLKTGKSISIHQKEIRDLLNQRRKAGAFVSPDPFLAVSRSLVAAVDAREKQYRKERAATAQARRIIPLQKTDTDKKNVVAELNRIKRTVDDEAILQLSESYKRGAVLAFYFADKLRGIEDSGFDIASSLNDWVFSLKPNAEALRLSQYSAEIKRAEAKRENDRTKTVAITTLVENPLTKKLLKIEKISEAKQFDKAEKQLEELLKENITNPLESARIYYALGRTASQSAVGVKDADELSRKLLKAKRHYENVLRIHSEKQTSDSGLISSTYFALGRIYEFAGQKAYALKIYNVALRFGDVDGGAYKEAFEAKRLLIQKKND